MAPTADVYAHSNSDGRPDQIVAREDRANDGLGVVSVERNKSYGNYRVSFELHGSTDLEHNEMIYLLLHPSQIRFSRTLPGADRVTSCSSVTVL